MGRSEAKCTNSGLLPGGSAHIHVDTARGRHIHPETAEATDIHQQEKPADRSHIQRQTEGKYVLKYSMLTTYVHRNRNYLLIILERVNTYFPVFLDWIFVLLPLVSGRRVLPRLDHRPRWHERWVRNIQGDLRGLW